MHSALAGFVSGGNSRVAHHEILEKLGEGGMRAVYRARDTHLDRFVAVKILPERLTDAARQARFVQEPKRLAR